MKMVIIKADPWKKIDMNEKFNLPETILVVSGTVAEPPKTAISLEFSCDKIKNIQIL